MASKTLSPTACGTVTFIVSYRSQRELTFEAHPLSCQSKVSVSSVNDPVHAPHAFLWRKLRLQAMTPITPPYPS
jgi:hypothetical protein